jgi:ribosomal protein S21
MSVRVVVSEGASVAVALRRLKQRMQDGGVFDEMMIHLCFESHRAKRRLKGALAKQRARDRAAWERFGLAVDDYAQ